MDKNKPSVSVRDMDDLLRRLSDIYYLLYDLCIVAEENALRPGALRVAADVLEEVHASLCALCGAAVADGLSGGKE